jgi:branched-chain amino acid transport system permease protein
VATAIGAVLAVLTEIFLIRPLYSRPHFDQLLVTTGLAFVLAGVLHGVWGADPRTMEIPDWLQDGMEIGGAQITYDRFIIVAAAAAIFIGTELFLKYTRFGLIVRAGVENRDMVRALGIDVRTSFTLIFTIGGAFAGFGGALAAIYSRSLTVEIGNTYLLFAFIVLVIGGLGSLRGALVASILIGLVQQFANYYINLGLGDLLGIALMAVVLLVRPQGLFGRKGRLV